MKYLQKLTAAVQSSGSLLSVGLDPDYDRIPAAIRESYPNKTDAIVAFCSQVIEATTEFCCSYKPNVAFFEAYGPAGWDAFERVIDRIPDGKILIADAKRGDIGNTAEQYKKAFFDYYGVDAITLNPLMGLETLTPFLNDESKAVYVLAMTSNIGSSDFLGRRFEGRMSQGEYIAEEMKKKQELSAAHIGMVTGATYTEAVAPVIAAYSKASLLIPGIGTQGGTVEKLAALLKNHKGIPVINSSRGILYAGGDSENWREKVGEAASKMKNDLKPITENFIS
jgi:orotidine-5'-phosphate decarboxylase